MPAKKSKPKPRAKRPAANEGIAEVLGVDPVVDDGDAAPPPLPNFYEFEIEDLLDTEDSKRIRRRSAMRYRRGQCIWKSEREYREAYSIYKDFLRRNPNVTDMGKSVKIVPEPPSVVDFCRFCGFSRQTFYRYERDDPKKGEEWIRDVTTEIAEDLMQRRANRAMRRVYDPSFVARYDRIAEVVEQVNYMPDLDPFKDLDGEAEDLLEDGEGIPEEFTKGGESDGGD